MTTVDTTTSLPEALLALADDLDPVARAVGAAVRRAATGDLDPGERGWQQAIEAHRAALDASPEEIDTALDGTSGSKPMVLGEVAARRSKKGLWALLLLTLGRELRPRRTIELGTCVGVSGAYLSAAARLNGGGALVTLEGAPALADRARAGFEALGLRDVEVVTGRFRDTLRPTLERLGAFDLAFVDGHHDEEATQAYFEQLLPHLHEGAVVVFDDIAWSDGMVRAWAALRVHPSVRLVVDLDRIGICVVGTGSGRRDIDLPSLTAMAGATRRAPEPTPPPPAPAVDLDALPVARLNWGCGARGEPGWLNSDVKHGPGIQHVGDIRDGLPLPDGSIDHVVSIHALPMVPIPDLVPTLQELRRVLRPGGVLRLGLPDLERALAAWQRGDRGYFLVADEDARTLSGKMITHLLWHGYSVTLFTAEWIEELLLRAGFSAVHHCALGESPTGVAGITELDNREHESLFVEAVR